MLNWWVIPPLPPRGQPNNRVEERVREDKRVLGKGRLIEVGS